VSRLRVVYIAGWGRSGSTLLENVLSHDGRAASIGESFQLWSTRSELARHCSCGELLERCPVWSRVQRGVTDDWPGLVAEMVRHRSALRIRNLRRIVSGDENWAGRAHVDAYAAVLGRVYRELAAVQGVDTIIDASKLPLVLAAAARIPDIDLVAVHLVRDPRGVIHSWSKPKTVAFADGRSTTMRSYGAAGSLERWALNHGLSSYVIRRLGVDNASVSYERFATGDSETLARLSGLTGIDVSGVGRERVVVPAQHAIAGNPGRVSDAHLVLRSDDAWRSELSWSGRALGSLGLPLRAVLVGRR
jgi:hypothetical protein